jgi:hypothetical protein
VIAIMAQIWFKSACITTKGSNFMFRKASVAQVETLTQDQSKAPSFWGFRRRVPIDPMASVSEDTAFTVDAIAAGFEAFGRAGMQLGGLHRDQQWVGAWGGRC